MTFLPIVERELRVTARRPGTYWMRFAVACAVIGAWFLLSVVGGRHNPPARTAYLVFVNIGIIGFVFSLLAGLFLTADCLSEEKREGTLGLLFLTDLKGYDVVFGKLISTSVHACCGLLAILPLLALPLLTGGVTAGEFWRVALVLVVTLFFSLSVGMVISAFHRETRQVMGLTLLVLVVLTGLLPALWWSQAAIYKIPYLDFLLWLCPAHAYQAAFDAWYGTSQGPREFWACVMVIAGLAVGALILASIVLPRNWQEKSSPADAPGKISWRQRFRFGDAKFRKTRRRLLDKNPFFWLATRDRLPLLMALPFFVAILVWLCLFVGCLTSARASSAQQVSFSVSMFMAYGLRQAMKCLVAIEASRRLSEDKQSGAMELLVITPLEVNQILRGQRQALGGFFRSSMLAVIFMNLALIWLFYWPDLLGGRPPPPLFYKLFLGGIILAMLDAYALSWVGMWMALAKQRHHRAVLATLGRVMVLPWALILFFVFLVYSGAGIGELEIDFMLFGWLILGTICDIFMASWARAKLHREFRQAVVGTRSTTRHPQLAMQATAVEATNK